MEIFFLPDNHNHCTVFIPIWQMCNILTSLNITLRLMKLLQTICAAAGLACFFSLPSHAIVLVSYTMDDAQDSTTSISPSSTDSSVTADDYAPTSPLGANVDGSDGLYGIQGDFTGWADDFDGAISDNYYFTFGVDATGAALNLSNLTVDVESGTGTEDESDPDATYSYQAGYSLDGGSSWVAIGSPVSFISPGVDRGTIDEDLSGITALQNVSSVDFAIALFSTGTKPNNYEQSYVGDSTDPTSNHIVLEGALVPEPSAAALLIGALGLFLLARRRR